MIKLFHDLNYRVVAEGIETSAAAELLRGFGCDEGQGYLFSQPLGIGDFEVLLQASHIPSVELQPSQAA
jgi:EAL domain-containing protein (putative c-di-GMP-specific phosphodiesterase class I)